MLFLQFAARGCAGVVAFDCSLSRCLGGRALGCAMTFSRRGRYTTFSNIVAGLSVMALDRAPAGGRVVTFLVMASSYLVPVFNPPDVGELRSQTAGPS